MQHEGMAVLEDSHSLDRQASQRAGWGGVLGMHRRHGQCQKTDNDKNSIHVRYLHSEANGRAHWWFVSLAANITPPARLRRNILVTVFPFPPSLPDESHRPTLPTI